MAFQIHALSPDSFDQLFHLTDEELAERRAVRKTADSSPGFPCRVSLRDADIGEEVILLSHRHQPADSPFRSEHAIYVRRGARQAFPLPDEVPGMFRHRQISVRAFDARDHIIKAAVVDGSHLAGELDAMLAGQGVCYLHLHNASLGCYMARATRLE